ncbi:Histidine kinase [Flavobacterium sp. 9AF]|uniref:Hpt domain-containing protein n=1 Tax=Flavobacterium sp. 9AF TaxID=2653142 RepID=UPI0012F28D31|nr:Hpt domain-containing protein [Flavobacterium sp. 9AF]VXB21690.1 Histidine kinase [Flavobacterium sp. 9AF]
MEQPNLTYINELSGDSLEFKNKMIAILKKELPEEIENYERQMYNANFLAAAQAVHKLKHKISILGLEKSYYLAETFEENLKQNREDLKNDFELILKNITDFVNAL